MPFSITGYVLEAPRVGSSNNPFTPTPNCFVYDPSAFSVAYPVAETNSRTDYLVIVLVDGKLADAQFGWTKNEGLVAGGPSVHRFDYDGKHQRFFPLPGGHPVAVGTLSSTSNTTRLKVPVPVVGVTPAAPFRLSIGATGSGITQAVTIVLNDAAFTPTPGPPAGTTELSATSGKLNWNDTVGTGDLTLYAGQSIRFQQQSPFGFSVSNGNIGIIANNTMILNPSPGTTQYPLLRIGFNTYLTAIEVPNEGSFSPDPASGTVEWALTTGLIKFNSTDITTNAGVSVYYDGILCGAGLTLPIQSFGTVNLEGNTGPQSSVLAPVPVPGGDIIFRVPGVVQFEQAIPVPVANFDSVGKQGQVQYDPITGQVILSLADRIAFGGLTLQVFTGDLPINHGIAIRLFRTPVDLAGADPSLKDVTSIYPVTGATLQSPITGTPFIFLPAAPLNAVAFPQRVYITQGTGNFPPADLPNLDLPSPPPGIGYTIDFDKSQLQYSFRQDSLLVTLPQATPTAVLPDPLLVTGASRSFALETGVGTNAYDPFTETPPGSGIFTSTSGMGGILDFTGGQFNFTQIAGQLKAEGTDASFDITGLLFTDPSTNFGADGVVPGDFLAILAGLDKGVYTITAVAGSTLTVDLPGTPNAINQDYEVHSSKEVLADRFFEQLELVDPNTKIERVRSLGTISNSPRLQVPISFISVVRFRFGGNTGTFSTSVVQQPTDGAFTNPSLLPQGTVEISQATGHINFSATDVLAGATVFWVRLLKQGKDYLITPELGNLNFMDRFLANEEAIITYASLAAPTVVIVEPATFLVRKELAQPHPLPTSTLTFNPLGRSVATTPPIRVWRGGRPQAIGTQCNVNYVNSTVTFLADSQLTDALPHGATVNPNENVYIDYFIYGAIGGEKTINVLQTPMNLAQVSTVNEDNSLTAGITAGATSFVVPGDYSADFPVNFIFRIEKDQIYQIGTSSFNPGTNLTSVGLIPGQRFTDTFIKPNLFVASGPTRTTSSLLFPTYFAIEPSSYDAVARGMNMIKVVGDRTTSYKAGVVLFLNGIDFYFVTGASYDSPTNRTKVTIARNTIQQYDSQILKYSVRPIFEASTTAVTTIYNPVLTQEILVWRRTEGSVGQILTSPTEYTIDQGGNVVVTTPLAPSEEISIFYTGHFLVQAGLRLQASYTNVIVPDDTNGLLGQNLISDYFTYNSDSFYFRVESMTIFRQQYAAGLQAQATASAPTGGPMTSNASSPQLFQQGRASIFFNEIDLGNDDLIARSTLKFYNDAVNLLEDTLHALDGRVVGDRNGRFLFDGNINNPVRPNVAAVTNQIDDVLKVSDAPYSISISPGFPPSINIVSIGTYQAMYLSSPISRFYPTKRHGFGAAAPAVNTGDEILDTGVTNITAINYLQRRSPWSVVLVDAPAGATTVQVDFAQGDTNLVRPAFYGGAKVQIAHLAGGVIVHDVSDASPLTVASSTATVPGVGGTLTFSGGLPVAVSAGATIWESTQDLTIADPGTSSNPPTPFYNLWSSPRYGRDYFYVPDTGKILYSKRVYPLDGSISLIPKSFDIQPIDMTWWGEVPQVSFDVNFSNTSTAPAKFPALVGGTTDDSGDVQLPVAGPSFLCELTQTGGGYLATENAIISSPSGTLRTATTAPYVGTGSLNVAKTIITDTSVSFPVPLPQPFDLVRILTGLNGATEFRRITSVVGNTITVDSPFVHQDAGFSYTIAVSSTTITGTGTFAGTTLTDLVSNFLTDGTTVGMTVVVTSGASAGQRRQVVTIVDAHHITLNIALTASGTYRIDNPLDTFNGFAQTDLVAALANEIATLTSNPNSELNSLYNFFTLIFTTVLPSTQGTVLITNLSELVDTSVDFIGPDPASPIVTPSNFIYIPFGTEMGVYKVASVIDSHHLLVTTPFPLAGASISYQVVNAFGAGLKTMQDLFSIIANLNTFVASTQTFQSLVTAPVTVLLSSVVDPNAFARGYLTTDLTARSTTVTNRYNYLRDAANGPIAKIQNALSGTEKLYDKRFTWIDARINLKTGILVQQTTAVATREAAQIDILNQLLKLLAVQAS